MKVTKRIGTLLLGLMTALNFGMNAPVVFAQEEMQRTVLSVETLEETVYEVSLGTALEEVGLPKTVSATLESKNDEVVTTEECELSVVWLGHYNADETGTYPLTAAFEDTVECVDSVMMPMVSVIVIEAQGSQALSANPDTVLEEAGIAPVNDGEDETGFNPLNYQASENGMDGWDGYATYRAFMDALPSLEEVSGYAVNSEQFDQLVKDMEQARELAKAVEAFVERMQDREMFMTAFEKDLEAQIQDYLDSGYTLTEEEIQEMKDQIPFQVDQHLEAWKYCKDTVVPEKITDPREKLFEQYRWYMGSTDTTDVVVKENLATISITEGANANLSKPEDFIIGKRGLETFTIGVNVDFNGFTNVEGLEGKAAVVRLPKGINFAADSFTISSNGESYEFTPAGNGKEELIIRFPDTFTGKFYQTFLVTQNATELINDLKNTKGQLNYTVNVYTGYRTGTQKLVVSEADQPHSAAMTFVVDDKTPEISVEIKKGNIDDIYYPKFFHDSNRETDAGNTATTWVTRGEVMYSVDIKKGEGYLSDDFTVDYHFPGIEEQVFYVSNSPYTVIYFTPEGETRNYYPSYTFRDFDVLHENGTTGLRFAALSGNRDAQGNFSSVGTNDTSFAEILYRPGTLHVELLTTAYINRLYDGDWNNTCYTSGENIDVQLMNHENGVADHAYSKTPLYFNFQNGDPMVGVQAVLHDREIYDGRFKNDLPSEMAQFGRNSDYEDSKWYEVYDVFLEDSDSSKGFAFYDNLSLTMEFTQELSPIALRGLEAGYAGQMTYRFYMTDAKTGKIAAIDTVVGREDYETYQAKTIEGITETVYDGDSTYRWEMSGADDPDNTRYVSKIEVVREQYEFNRAITDNGIGEIKLRARHTLLSDHSVDIPDGFDAKFTMVLNAESPAIHFEDEFTVKLRHLSDNITLQDNADCANYIMEINEHNAGSRAFTYSLVKYADTMKYNTNASGEDIAFGEEGYDPIVAVLSGNVITVTDRLEEKGQRILGVYGNDGTYYDLGEQGINADDYVITPSSEAYWETDLDKELYSTLSNHQKETSQNIGAGLYDLSSIYEKLGIDYAEKLVVALTNVNDQEIGGGNDRVAINYSAGIHKIAPGYLNYDQVIGITSAADGPVKLNGSVELYCKYSDYLNAERDGNPFVDTNDANNVVHGPSVQKVLNATSVSYGSYTTGIEYLNEQTQYVNPFADDYQLDPAELVVFNMKKLNGTQPQIDYSEVVYDLTGTDPSLLALTNTVTFNYSSNTSNDQAFDVALEYTLSDGTTVKTEPKRISGYVSSGVYYRIPELFDNRGNALPLKDKYLTGLKIIFPDGVNWGYGDRTSAVNDCLPGFGLAIKGVGIPETYPNDPSKKVGTMNQDDALGRGYDNLNAKVSVYFKDVLGNVLADGTGNYVAEGLSKRIGMPKIYVSWFETDVRYGTTSRQEHVYQNETVDVVEKPTLKLLDSENREIVFGNLKGILKDYGIHLKPTFYYEIDEGFTYVPDSFYMTKSSYLGDTVEDTEVQVRYIDSYKDGKGLLIISYDHAENEDFIYPDNFARKFNFKLRARYDAKVGDTRPITAAWADAMYNRNLDGSYDTSGQLAQVDTKNTTAGAPYGDEIGNVGKLAANANGEYEMLKANPYGGFAMVSVQEKVFTGMLNFVKAYAPEAEDEKSVASKDILAEENLFGYKSYLTGDPSSPTHDWELYTVVPKEGETFGYYDADAKAEVSEASMFSMVFNGVDVSKLEEENVEYKLYYTTDPTPANNGYATMKDCAWTEYTLDQVETLDLESITGLKLWVKELASKQKISLETKFRLANHKEEVGEEVAYIMSYVNYKLGKYESGGNVWAAGDRGFCGFVPQEYHLEDMKITGFAWMERDYNSIYDAETDQKYAGVAFRVYDENGNEVLQEKSRSRVVSEADGSYRLLVPHDGKWQVEAEAPEGIRLVNPHLVDDTAITSSFDRNTKKTEIIDFVSDYRTLSFTQTNVNIGIYVAPKLNFPPVIEIPVDSKKEGSFEVTVENRVPNTVSVIERKENESDEIANINDGGDDHADFDGKKSGSVFGKVSIDDGYGGTVEGEFKVIVYANVIYDITNRNTDRKASETTGNAPVDSNHYYPSVDENGNDLKTDVAIVKGSDGFASSGYVFVGWALSDEEAKNGIVRYESEDEVKLGACTQNLTLHAVYKKCTPVEADPPVSKKISGDRPEEDTEFTFTLTADRNTADHVMPMPAEAHSETSMTKTILGEGETEFGNITFEYPGVYEYTIREKNDGVERYTYDTSVYVVKYQVTQNNDALQVKRTITKDGKYAESVVFTNNYRIPRSSNTKPAVPNTSDPSSLPWILLTVSGLVVAAGALLTLKMNHE